jgi:hypothetical protein
MEFGARPSRRRKPNIADMVAARKANVDAARGRHPRHGGAQEASRQAASP